MSNHRSNGNTEPKSNANGNRIEDETIFLDGEGKFPKKLIIAECEVIREYRIIKTKKGGYLLN